ncbi:MAG: hydroxyacid dehydrogenase [Thermoanaerobaculia bacterium]
MTEKPKILVNCLMHEDGLAVLAREGCEAIIVPESDPQASWDRVPPCAGMVANASLALDDRFFAAAPRLRVVGRHGVGYDNVDLEAARRRGIRVVNTPLPIIEPVAEHAAMLLLAAARRLTQGHAAVRAGRWRAPDNLPGPELAGKTLGLVGLGNTGRRLAEIAVLGFKMEVLYFDRVARPEAEKALGARRASFEEVLAGSDFVSLHVNLSSETRRLIDARAFSLMKPGVIFINAARGPLVDEAALIEALDSGRVAGAGLDVFVEEPPPADHPLLRHPNVVLTPHVAGGSNESKRGCSMVALDVVKVLRGQEPAHPVV